MSILFRGKRKDTHEWAYGYIIQEPSGRAFIGTYLPGGMWDWVEVEVETVGAYAGTTDKNRIKIFRGDVVRFSGKLFTIEWLAKYARFAGTRPGCVFASFLMGACEVIGNRWDGPNLL